MLNIALRIQGQELYKKQHDGYSCHILFNILFVPISSSPEYLLFENLRVVNMWFLINSIIKNKMPKMITLIMLVEL